ncbi:MAG: MFS transporter [Paenibacillaceae bacterium]|nr:MFS transporter [Paenibacillaceae bacterium]
MAEDKLWNRNYVAVCLSSFFLFLVFYMLAVTLPVYVEESLQVGKERIGLVMTAFILANVVFRPIAGRWLDEWNRKKIVLFSLVLFLVCSVAYSFVHDYYVLLLLRVAHGIGFGIAATATGAIAVDFVPEHRKGEGIGYFGLFMSLAMVIGPFIGLSIVEQYEMNAMFLTCLLFALLALASGAVLRIPARPAGAAKAGQAVGWRRYVVEEAIPISLTGTLLAFAYGTISTFLSVYAKEIGFGAIASYFFMVFAATIVVSRPFTGRWYDRSGPNGLVYGGLLLFAGGMIWLGLAHAPVAFLAAGAVLGLGYGALLPSYQTIAIQQSPAHRRGLATGTFFLFFDSGYGIGSSVLGVVAAHTSYRDMYVLAALIVFASSGVYYLLHHRRANAKTQPQLR